MSAFPPKALALMTSTNHTAASRFLTGSDAFAHKHLLGIAGLQPWEIEFILCEAEHWVALNRSGAAKHDDRLRGLTIINAFFENSTRTLLSFEIAGKRLGADVVNMHASQSSIKKGETLIDTDDVKRDARRCHCNPPRRVGCSAVNF
jgi:aspartate carbamoyltransferase catalytic subunit